MNDHFFFLFCGFNFNLYSLSLSMSCNFGPFLGLAVKHHPHDGHREPGHAHDRDRVPEYQHRNDGRHRRFGVAKYLQSQCAGVLGHQEVGQVDQVSHRGIPDQQENNERVAPGLLHRRRRHVALDVQSEGQQNAGSHWSHVQKQVHRVELLSFGGEQDPLNDGFQSSPGGGPHTD